MNKLKEWLIPFGSVMMMNINKGRYTTMKKNTLTFAELVNYYQSQKGRNSKSKNWTGVILETAYADRDRKGNKR